MRTRRWLAAALLALVVVAPAEAKEKPPKADSVAVSRAGEGVAPGAPAWVRDGVARIHSGAIEQGGEDGGGTRGLQSVRKAMSVGCRDVWAYRGYDHVLGYNLFRYYQQVSWCSNGLWIYSWSRFRWPELNFPGWAFDGHIGSHLAGTSTWKRAWTQGAFRNCIAGWCDYKVPWVNIEVNVNGGWSANTGG